MAKKRVVLRSWRVQVAEPSGLFVWYDPARESVELYELEPDAKQRVADASEGDDQKGLWDVRDQVTMGVEVDDLPF